LNLALFEIAKQIEQGKYHKEYGCKSYVSHISTFTNSLCLSTFVSKVERVIVGRDDPARRKMREGLGIAQTNMGKVTDSPEIDWIFQTGTAGTPGSAFPTQSPDG